MRKLLFLLVLAFLFMFVFIKSNTLEIRQEIVKKGEFEYFTTKPSIHWDRFLNYIKNSPERIFGKQIQ